jgi:hypothetical protein
MSRVFSLYDGFIHLLPDMTEAHAAALPRVDRTITLPVLPALAYAVVIKPGAYYDRMICEVLGVDADSSEGPESVECLIVVRVKRLDMEETRLAACYRYRLKMINLVPGYMEVK